MDSQEPVTYLLQQVHADSDEEATRKLWELYFARLVRLARQKLKGLPRRAADEEDVALSAFGSFCRAVQANRFPKLEDRNDLWQILVMLTLRKAIKLIHFESRDKRDFRKAVYEANTPTDDESAMSLFREIISREPNPHLETQVVEDLDLLLSHLESPKLQRLGPELKEIAMRKMDGYTNAEIAEEMKISLSKVERRLALIRDLWTAYVQE